MTVPVAMECKPDTDTTKQLLGDGIPAPIERTHFLLEKISSDEPTIVGPIKIADMPSMRVLSIAFPSDSTLESVKRGQTAIESRLEKIPGIERAGEYRILS